MRIGMLIRTREIKNCAAGYNILNLAAPGNAWQSIIIVSGQLQLEALGTPDLLGPANRSPRLVRDPLWSQNKTSTEIVESDRTPK